MKPLPLKSYHYDYQALDEFLQQSAATQEVSNSLDTSMFDHVRVSSVDTIPADEDHYGLLRELRNLFANLSD